MSLLLLSLAIAMSLPVAAQNSAAPERKSDPVVLAQFSATNELKLDKEERPRKWSGDWNFSMGGAGSQEGKDEGAAAFLYAGSRFNYTFTPWFKAYLEPRIGLFSSRVQERYDDDNFENGIWLNDGYMSVEPIPYAEARLGTLSQRYHQNAMLVSNYRSFPGVQLIGKGEVGEVKGRVIVQNAIPTSHSLNTERQSQEKLPAFTTQTLALEGEHRGWIQWQGTAGLYQWSNIPSKVAYESRRQGNVGEGENAPDSRLRYEHKGLYGGAEVCLCDNSALLGWTFEYQRINNTEAPSNAADAQLFGGGPRLNLGNVTLDLRVRSLFIESEATIAAYNKSRYGNTNREGMNVELNLAFKEQGFSLFAETYQMKPINYDPEQRDLNVYYFGVETDYASF